MDLPEALARFGPNLENLFKVGTVSGTSGSNVIVTVSGVSYTLPKLQWYTPVNGDVVQILWIPGRPLVLGDIG